MLRLTLKEPELRRLHDLFVAAEERAEWQRREMVAKGDHDAAHVAAKRRDDFAAMRRRIHSALREPRPPSELEKLKRAVRAICLSFLMPQRPWPRPWW